MTLKKAWEKAITLAIFEFLWPKDKTRKIAMTAAVSILQLFDIHKLVQSAKFYEPFLAAAHKFYTVRVSQQFNLTWPLTIFEVGN